MSFGCFIARRAGKRCGKREDKQRGGTAEKMLSDRLSGIQRNNQANLATARARAVQRGLGTPTTAPRPQVWSEAAPQQRTSGSRPSNSTPMRSTTDARSIAELGQVSQQITNRIHAARHQGASPQSYAPATAPRPSPLPARTNPYYQKYGHANYSEQLHNVDHAIEDTLEQLDVIAHRLNARLERRPSIDELQQRGVIPSTAGAPQLAASALALERRPAGSKRRPRLHPPPLLVSRCCNSSPHPVLHPPSHRPTGGRLAQLVSCPATEPLRGAAGGHHQGGARRRAAPHRGVAGAAAPPPVGRLGCVARDAPRYPPAPTHPTNHPPTTTRCPLLSSSLARAARFPENTRRAARAPSLLLTSSPSPP